MITILLIGLLFIEEIFFLIWNLKEKKRHDREKMIFRFVFAAFLSFLMFISLLEGISRYGILIVILLLQSLIAFWVISKKKENHVKISGQIGRGIANLLLYTVALLPAILFPQYKEPKVTGDYQVAIQEYTWVDESRTETYSDTGENRAVTVKFWYPEKTGTYPLVVFSHGATGVIDSNFSTCKELASNGYVVASIAHTYHAFFVKDVNGKVTTVDMDFFNQVMTINDSDTPEHEEAAYEMSRQWMEVRTGDENFVLDTILTKANNKEAGPFCRINPDKIGLFGHSLGGATSAMVGRERTDIDAVIILEGTMLGDYVGYENGDYVLQQEPYPIPLLDVNSRAAYEQACGYKDREYVNFYVGKNTKDFKEVVFNDAGHLNFTDLPLVSPVLANMMGTGDVNARTCIENVNEMVLNYFNYYLKDAPELNIQDEY